MAAIFILVGGGIFFQMAAKFYIKKIFLILFLKCFRWGKNGGMNFTLGGVKMADEYIIPSLFNKREVYTPYFLYFRHLFKLF